MQAIDNAFSHKITFFSLFLAISIVCYHLNPIHDYQTIVNGGRFLDVVANYLNELLNSFGSLALSFFFMSSAFLLYRNFRLNQFSEKLKKRAIGLFVPLLVWNILCLIYKLRFFDGFWETIQNILLSNYCGPLWFVVQLLGLLLLSPVFLLLFKNKLVALLLVVLSYFMPQLFDLHIVRMLSQDEAQVLVLSRTIHYLPLYFTGIYMAKHGDASVQEERYKTKGTLILAGILLVVTLLPGEQEVLIFLRQFQILAIWTLVPNQAFRKSPSWVFQISFFIYASHAIAIGIIMRFFHRFILDETVPVTIGTAVTARLAFTLISIACIYLVAWILIRWFPSFYAILSGGRVPEQKTMTE